MRLPRTFLGVVLFMLLLRKIRAKSKLFNIFWNSSNPIFNLESDENIIDVNVGNSPWEYDQANIICPSYSYNSHPGSKMERYVIYAVSAEDYLSCRLNKATTRVVAKCDNPTELLYVTITFRSFTPTPGGMEFQPGRDYFFVSTTSPISLGDSNCNRGSPLDGMRVLIRVAPDERVVYAVNNGQSAGAQVNVPRRSEHDDPSSGYPPLYSEIDSNSVVEHRKRSHQELVNVMRKETADAVKQTSSAGHASAPQVMLGMFFIAVMTLVRVI